MEAYHRPPNHQQALRYIAKPNDPFVFFDLKDDFYALLIHPKGRESFTVNLDG